MANVGSGGIVRYEETFQSDHLKSSAADGIGWLTTTDSGCTEFVRAVAAGKGLHVAGAIDTTDNDRIEFLSDKFNFAGQEGHASVEIIIQFDDVTGLAFNFGFFDAVTGASNVIPAQISGTTLAGSAADGFLGFVYDTDATYDDLYCTWENGAAVTTMASSKLRMKGMSLTDDKWMYLKVSMQDVSSTESVRATFLAVDHRGRSMEKTFNTTVDRDLPLCYYLGVENRAAAAHNVYFRGVAWEQTIADM